MKISKSVLTFFLVFGAGYLAAQLSTISSTKYTYLKVAEVKSKEAFYFRNLLSDRLTVIIFHSFNCPFNSIYAQKIDGLTLQYQTDSVQFIYVNSNSMENDGTKLTPDQKTFITNTKPLYVLDRDQKIMELMGVTKNGIALVCLQKGRGIEVYYQGSIDDAPKKINAQKNYLKTAIDNGLATKTTFPDGISTGCRIVSH